MVRLKGIVPADYEPVIGHFFDAGNIDVLRPGSFNAVLGRGVMQQLGLAPDDVFTAVMPDMAVTPLGVFPARKRLRAAGVLRTWSQLDGQVAYIHIGTRSGCSARLRGRGRSSCASTVSSKRRMLLQGRWRRSELTSSLRVPGCGPWARCIGRSR